MASGTSTKVPVKPTPVPHPHCRVVVQPDGALHIDCLIDPDVAKRIIQRAGPMTLDRYVWENILQRAFEGHVF